MRAGYIGAELARTSEYLAERRHNTIINQFGAANSKAGQWREIPLQPLDVVAPPPMWTLDDVEDAKNEHENQLAEAAFDRMPGNA